MSTDRCGCERGLDCTRSTVCALNHAVEEALEEHANLKEFSDEVITYATDYMNTWNHGRSVSKARSNLFEAITRYEMEIA